MFLIDTNVQGETYYGICRCRWISFRWNKFRIV